MKTHHGNNPRSAPERTAFAVRTEREDVPLLTSARSARNPWKAQIPPAPRCTRAIWAACILTSVTAWAADPASPDAAAAFRTKFDREPSPGRAVLVSTRVDKGPVIDGEVDKDPVWPACGRTHGAWTQIGRGEVSGRQTAVYSCYDRENLYFGFVCEEPELQGVRMDGTLAQAFEQVGPDDCVEVIVEVGGVQGDGDAYSFRANARSQRSAWGGTSIPSILATYHVPTWTSAGKFGPNRWMVEMAIPFAQLKRLPYQAGLASPSRGDVLGLKLLRYGAQQQDPRNRMVSTWNTDIVLATPYIAGFNGLLYFEDSNSLRDGNFAAAKDSPWERKGAVATPTPLGVSLGQDACVSQSVDVRPNRFYVFTVDAGGGTDLTVDGAKLLLKNGQAGYWTGQTQSKAVVAVSVPGGAAAVAVRKVLMEYQPGEEPAGPSCLTGNYRHADRNIRARVPDAPDGRYRYVNIDYVGQITADNNPAIRVNSWAFDYNARVEDVGGREGWIAFAKGSLTGKAEPVFWQTANPADPACWGRQRQVVDIDLGAEYWVSGVDVLWPAPNVVNFEVWGKVKPEDDWTYLYTGDGPFVEPSHRRQHRRAYEHVRGLDSVVRYLRWRATPSAGDYIYPQMDGIQEFWVWGEPRGDRRGIKPFAAWIPGTATPPAKAQTAVLDPDAILIVPRPRKLDREDGWFVIGARTRIVAQAESESRKVARQIREEVLDRWQLDVPVVEEAAAAGTNLDDAVYVGQPAMGPVAERLRQEEGLEIDTARPQGYGLRASPRRVVVLGRDAEGLYWGVQSLMMAMRWKAGGPGGPSGPGVHAMKVVDWPGTPDRGFLGGKNYAAMLNFPESEIHRIKRICQLCSRFKINAIYLNPKRAGEGWSPGTLTKLCREIREEYHLELRPDFFDHPRWNESWWRWVLDEDVRANPSRNYLSAVERDPDENVGDCGAGLNLCPLDPLTYEMVFARMDDILDAFAHPSRMYLFGMVNNGTAGGARWGTCRRCLRSGKSPEELYVVFLRQIAAHLQERQTIGIIGTQSLSNGPRATKDRRLVALDFREVPGALFHDVPAEGPEAAAMTNLPPARCTNGPRDWPSGGRFDLGAFTETEMLVSIAGGDIQWGNGSVFRDGSILDRAEIMWYAPDRRPSTPPDTTEVGSWVYAWWFRRDLPGWRAGAHPSTVCLDLRPYANHGSQATGTETLQPGRPPEIDLRYVPTGRQTLANVPFEIIDPAANGGKSIVMLGRPPASVLPSLAPTITEKAGPIPVGRKLASLAFLRTRWQSSVEGMHWGEYWLRPTCRVVYDDGSWLVVDSFQHPVEGFVGDNWRETDSASLYSRLGWRGNAPTGDSVGLNVVEWVNPYPEKIVSHLEFVTPDFENVRGGSGKRVNSMCEAMVAITGIEPIEQDVVLWSRRADRVPRLPAQTPPRTNDLCLAIEGRVDTSRAESTGAVDFRFLRGTEAIPCTAKLNGASFSDGVQGLFYRGFTPFGVTLEFGAPLRLARVEVRGPFQSYGGVGPREQRRHKVDVVVECSEDGEHWQRAGELRGLSAEADFLAVDLPAKPVKAVRLTATGAPYHNDYHPAAEHGGMFENPAMCPHFTWRLFAPANPPG